jgi:methionyl aminopeptidase
MAVRIRSVWEGNAAAWRNCGGSETRVLEDDWTVVTVDGSRAAHWEHSTAIMADGIIVLTAVDGGAERLGVFGVEPVSLD